MIEIVDAIKSLCPTASFSIENNDYDKISWSNLNNDALPTKEEVEVELARLQAEYDSKEYQRQRAVEYPSFADQMDLLYHGGYDAWKQAIQEIKDKYPKPENI